MKTLADKSNGALISLQDENDPKFNHAGFLTDLIPNLMNNYVDLEDCDPEEFVASEVFIYGNTIDLFSKEKLARANLVVYKNGVFHQGKPSDQNGFYSLELKPGVYDFKFSYIGFQDKEIKNVIIGKEEELELNATLQMGINMDCCGGKRLQNTIDQNTYRMSRISMLCRLFWCKFKRRNFSS